jgi:hypothetical protein
MLSLLLGPIVDLVKTVTGGFIDSAKAKRQLKAATQQTKLKIEYAKATADIDWDAQAMLNSQNSWKDEWFVILLSVPAVMAFIPGLAPFVELGFVALAKSPDWYLGAFGIAVAASFGVRKFASKLIDRVKA